MLFKRLKGRGLLATNNPKNLFAQGEGQGVANPIYLPPAQEMPSTDIRDPNSGKRPSELVGGPMIEGATENSAPRQPTPREVFDYEGARKQLEANNKSASWADRFARAAAFMNDDWGRAVNRPAILTPFGADRPAKLTP